MRSARYGLAAIVAVVVGSAGSAEMASGACEACVTSNHITSKLLVTPVGRPAWSPNGTTLVTEGVKTPRSSSSQLLAVAANGGPPRALTRSTRGVFHSDPAWQPTGRLIAFRVVHGQQTGDASIAVARISGGSQRVLTPSGRSSTFLWSPTGAVIAFAYQEGGLRLIRADGTGARVLVQDIDDYSTYSWSPDGLKMAFVYPGGGIGVVSLNGFPRRLTDGGMDPRWSPVGEWIAYTDDTELHLVRSDGLRDLTLIDGVSPISEVSWSPNGHRIAFEKLSPTIEASLFVVDVRDLRKWFIASRVLTSSWSASSQQIAYAAHTSANTIVGEVNIVRFDGVHRRHVGAGYMPTWAPEEERLAYLFTESFDFSNLCVVDSVDGSQVCPLYRPAKVVLASTLRPPVRLRIGSIAVRPTPLATRRSVDVTVRVRDTRGRLVAGATVSAIVYPRWFVGASARTRGNGQAKLILRPTKSLRFPGRVRIMVAARRPGDGPSSPNADHRAVWLDLTHRKKSGRNPFA